MSGLAIIGNRTGQVITWLPTNGTATGQDGVKRLGVGNVAEPKAAHAKFVCAGMSGDEPADHE